MNKSYVMFKAEKRDALLSSLAKAKVRVNSSQIKEYNYDGTDLSGKQSKDYRNYMWVDLAISDREAYAIPEVEYAAPYYYGDSHDDTYPLTNLIYVYLKDDGDVYLLEKVAKEYIFKQIHLK